MKARNRMWMLRRRVPLRLAIQTCMAVLCVTALTSSNVEACSCPSPGPPCENAFKGDAVFLGTATNITAVRGTPPSTFSEYVVTFALERAFLGVENANVAVRTGYGGGDCGYRFKVGQRYVVYAYRAKDGTLTTGICTRTRLA